MVPGRFAPGAISGERRPGVSATQIVESILEEAGTRRRIEVVSEELRGNACATISPDSELRIFVDEEWLSKITDELYWLKVFILAHEVGHHMNSHQIGFENRNVYQNEIDADYFAGRIVGDLGGPLELLRKYFEVCPFEETSSHVSRPSAARLPT